MLPTIKMTAYQELIDGDDQIAQNQFSDSLAVSFVPEVGGLRISGAQFKFEFAGGGTGTALHPSGTLYFFNANPVITAGDAVTSLTEAKVNMIVGQLDLASTDWITLVANALEFAQFSATWPGSDAEQIRLPRWLTLYVAFLYTGATTINSAAGDAESLSLRFFYN